MKEFAMKIDTNRTFVKVQAGQLDVESQSLYLLNSNKNIEVKKNQ